MSHLSFFDKGIVLAALSALPAIKAGAIEFYNNRVYITNKSVRKAIDRTSDVAIETVTVTNTLTETTLWTGAMPANSLVAGNLLNFHANGVVSNNGPSADDQITIRIRVGGVQTVILTPATKALSGDCWCLNGTATQRTIGTSGSRAVRIELDIDDVSTRVIAVAAVNTEANMDVTVTAEWASAKAANTISLYQGYMKYKN